MRQLLHIVAWSALISHSLPYQVIGTIDGSGRVVLVDRAAPEGSPTPVDLDLEKVLGDMPNKTFRSVHLWMCHVGLDCFEMMHVCGAGACYLTLPRYCLSNSYPACCRLLV